MKKRNFFYGLLAAFALQTSFTACSSDDEPGIDENSSLNPSYSMTEQKDKLESTGLSLSKHLDSKNLEPILSLGDFVTDNYINDYNNDVVSNWLDNCLDLITEQVKGAQNLRLIENEYNRYFLASNFTGHFTAVNGGWEQEKADDLQFNFKDGKNQDCVLSLTTSGKTVKVFMTDEEDWYYYGSDGYGNYNEYLDIYNLYIGVPEHLTLKLTQNGSVLVEVNLNSDLNMVTDEFDLSTDRFSTNLVAKVLDYQINVDEMAIDNKVAKCKAYFNQGNTRLLFIEASGNGTFANEDYRTINAFVDVMGSVQVKGSCNDTSSLIEALDKADDTEDMKKLESYKNKINDLINLGIFYDNKAAKQAELKFDITTEEDYGYKYNYLTPIVSFSEDGSKFSTVEVFFNQDDFKELIDTCDKILNGYQDRFC